MFLVGDIVGFLIGFIVGFFIGFLIGFLSSVLILRSLGLLVVIVRLLLGL